MKNAPRFLLCSALLSVLLVGGFAAFQAPPADAAPLPPCYTCAISGTTVGFGLTQAEAHANAVADAQARCGGSYCGNFILSTQKLCDPPYFCVFAVTIAYSCWQCIT